MKKGIVLLDMPKGCLECEHRSTYFRCYFTNQSVLDFCGVDDSRPESCPVQAIPNEKNMNAANTMTDFGWINGWNACLSNLR